MYALEINTLNTELKIFLSRNVQGESGEDLVEKQNAEQGLMPVLADEAGIYGYTDENRHMVECFRSGQRPSETFEDGVAVVEMLMALVILAMLMTAVAVAFDASVTNFQTNEGISKTMNMARSALLRITTELRTAQGVAIIGAGGDPEGEGGQHHRGAAERDPQHPGAPG